MKGEVDIRRRPSMVAVTVRLNRLRSTDLRPTLTKT
jgi:hypothetical protein